MRRAAEIAAELDEDLAKLRDARVLAAIEAFRLTPPRPIRLAWDYGTPGETFDGWLVFDDPGQRTGIAYCNRGFGPQNPWGLIETSAACPSMGMDSGWFPRFLDAYLDSFSATDLPIWKAVRWNNDRSRRTSITDELSWDEAWDVVNRLRTEDAEHRYDCEHDICY